MPSIGQQSIALLLYVTLYLRGSNDDLTGHCIFPYKC
jgi:hypothetical protein